MLPSMKIISLCLELHGSREDIASITDVKEGITLKTLAKNSICLAADNSSNQASLLLSCDKHLIFLSRRNNYPPRKLTLSLTNSVPSNLFPNFKTTYLCN